MKIVKVSITILLILNIVILVILLCKEPIRELTLVQYQSTQENIENIEEVLKQYKGSQTMYSLKNAIDEYLNGRKIEYTKLSVVLNTVSLGNEDITFQVQVDKKDNSNIFLRVIFLNKAKLKDSVKIEEVN